MSKRALLTATLVCLVLSSFVSAAQAQGGIEGVNPSEGTVGTEVTISGSGFGEKQGTVLLGEEKCRVLAWSDAEIAFLVNKPQPAGEYTIKVLLQGDKKPVEPIMFDAFEMQRPKITPESLVLDGNTATIEGAFFGDRKGEVGVAYLHDGGLVVEKVKALDWSMGEIRFEVPDELTGRFMLGVRNDVGAGGALLGEGLPGSAVTYKQVSAGQWNTCAVRTTGAIDCWGEDDHGILNEPTGTFLQVAVASWHACAIRDDGDGDNAGSIVCWGSEDGGRISGAPTGNDFTQISVGDWHGCGITTNQYGQSRADCWGKSDGTRTNDSDMANVVSSGNWHNCAVYADKHVGCWGIEDDGRISGAPGGNFKDVGVGDWHSCAVTTGGTLACWGNNDANRVSPLPADWNVADTYKQITAGNWHSCALKNVGQIACWGSDDDHRVSGTPFGIGFTQIDAGDRHTCTILSFTGDGTGQVYCWGNNGNGQCNVPTS